MADRYRLPAYRAMTPQRLARQRRSKTAIASDRKARQEIWRLYYVALRRQRNLRFLRLK